MSEIDVWLVDLLTILCKCVGGLPRYADVPFHLVGSYSRSSVSHRSTAWAHSSSLISYADENKTNKTNALDLYNHWHYKHHSAVLLLIFYLIYYKYIGKNKHKHKNLSALHNNNLLSFKYILQKESRILSFQIFLLTLMEDLWGQRI